MASHPTHSPVSSDLKKHLVSWANQKLRQPGDLSFVVSYPLNYKKNNEGFKVDKPTALFGFFKELFQVERRRLTTC